MGIEEYPAKTLSLIVRCRNAVNSDLLGIFVMPIAARKPGKPLMAWIWRMLWAIIADRPFGGAPCVSNSVSRI